ncbi:MAG: A/G-specific adenine glycosylase [Xanthobacteraceae bacterium]|nr:A/G-specific adenine glycosylase [Xanthobacteraceae bacterium]
MRETSRAGREQRAKPKAAPDAGVLLAWYDQSARVLPWRARGGAKPDPYRVWLSEIMLQQTRVETVLPYYAKFLARWPDVTSLANARQEEVLSAWAGLGYYARARNLHACAKAVVAEFAGAFPEGEDELRRLPGIGVYTSAAISAIAFGRKATPVDGNIERVMSRLFAVEEKLPAAKKTLSRLAAEMTPAIRAGDFAQAMMDLGATICTPKRPACAICPWMDVCIARARGDQETFPRKTAKEEGKLRKGAAFVVLREDGHILLRTRGEKGLLAGMSEVPGSEWSAEYKESTKAAPVAGLKWEKTAGVVRHVFTHFPLELTVYRAGVAKRMRAPKAMRFVALGALEDEALPSVMRKVIAHALEIERKPKGRRK